jgi:hypothetical protein
MRREAWNQRQDLKRLDHQALKDQKGDPGKDRRAQAARRSEQAHTRARKRKRVPKKRQPSSPEASVEGQVLAHAGKESNLQRLDDGARTGGEQGSLLQMAQGQRR